MTALQTPMLLTPLLLLLLRNGSAANNSNRTCSALGNFDKLTHNVWLQNSDFEYFPSGSLMACVKECLLRKKCQSFNFNVSNGMCQLNFEDSTAPTTAQIISTTNTVFSNIVDWPQDLAGACAGHTCSEDSVCTDLNDTATCDVSYCREISNGGTETTLIPIGTELTCGSTFFKSGESVCSENGTWVGNGTCVRLPSSCSSVLSCKSDAEDGEYWLYSFYLQTSIRVYCAGMNSGFPSEYITLNGINYSNYSDLIIDSDCSLGHHACGTTTFSKVKLDSTPKYLRVHWPKYDTQYATASGSCPVLPYGSAAGCSLRPGCSDLLVGSFRIDTSGTGLVVDSNLRWMSNQGEANVVRSDNGRVLEGTCLAACSECFPQNDISFVADDYRPPSWSATAIDAWGCENSF